MLGRGEKEKEDVLESKDGERVCLERERRSKSMFGRGEKE